MNVQLAEQILAHAKNQQEGAPVTAKGLLLRIPPKMTGCFAGT